MNKTKFSLFILLLISIFIVLGTIICCGDDKCCKNPKAQEKVNIQKVDSNSTTQKNHDELMLRKFQSYTISLTDSLKKQDSIYNESLQEIINLFKRKVQINKKYNDSCSQCICQENNIYEFNYHSYYGIQNKLLTLQKKLSSRSFKIQMQKEILETIMNDSIIYSQIKETN